MTDASGATGRQRKRTPQPDPRNICARCGQHRFDHVLVNYADGELVGRTYLLCPLPEFQGPEVPR